MYISTLVTAMGRGTFTFIPGICYLTLSLLSFNKMFMLSTQVSFFSFFREILYMGEIPTLSTGNRL